MPAPGFPLPGTRPWGARLAACLLALALLLLPAPASATTLKPETAAAFDDYVRATEARMDADIRDNRFFVIDDLPPSQRMAEYDAIRRGKLYVRPLHTDRQGQPIEIPSGLVYDWVGLIFIPNVTLAQVTAFCQDYADQIYFYRPDVIQSKLVAQDGHVAKVHLRLYSKVLITVVYDVDTENNYTFLPGNRALGTAFATRISQVAHWGHRNEHDLPPNGGDGFLWRLRSYWHLQQVDGGVLVQLESLGLSRSVPLIFAWLTPFLRSIPQGYLSRTLLDTRNAIEDPAAYGGHVPAIAAVPVPPALGPADPDPAPDPPPSPSPSPSSAAR